MHACAYLQINEKMEQMFGNLVHPGNPNSVQTGTLGEPDDVQEWRMYIRSLARHEIFGGPAPVPEREGAGNLYHDKYVDPYEIRKKEVRNKGTLTAVKNLADVPR
jgi:hypothetical protein